MHELFCSDTDVGRFFIVASADGRCHSVFKSFSLGTADSPHQAAEKLAAGDTLPFPKDLNFASLNIPADLREWNVCSPGTICPVRRRRPRAQPGHPGRGPGH